MERRELKMSSHMRMAIIPECSPVYCADVCWEASPVHKMVCGHPNAPKWAYLTTKAGKDTKRVHGFPTWCPLDMIPMNLESCSTSTQ